MQKERLKGGNFSIANLSKIYKLSFVFKNSFKASKLSIKQDEGYGFVLEEGN